MPVLPSTFRIANRTEFSSNVYFWPMKSLKIVNTHGDKIANIILRQFEFAQHLFQHVQKSKLTAESSQMNSETVKN